MNERVVKNKTSATPSQAIQSSSPLLHQRPLTEEQSESLGNNSNLSKELGGIQPKTIRRSLNWQNITVEASSRSDGKSLPSGIQRQQEEAGAVSGDSSDLSKSNGVAGLDFTSATDKPFGLKESLDEIREQHGDLGVKVVTETEAKAKDIISSGSSKKQRGPVVSGITDPITRETYFGQNFTKGQINSGEFERFKENLHPFLKGRLENYQQKLANGEINAARDDIARAGLPGSHSEIMALDKTLKAMEQKMGKELSDAKVSDLLPNLLLHNRSLNNPNGVPPRCVNCFNITEGISVIGND